MVVFCFWEKTNETLHCFKNVQATLCLLGVHTPATRSCHCEAFLQQQQYRSQGFSGSWPSLLDSRTSPEKDINHRGGLLGLTLNRQLVLHHHQISNQFDFQIQDNIPVVTSMPPSPEFRDGLSHLYSAWDALTVDKCV